MNTCWCLLGFMDAKVWHCAAGVGWQARGKICQNVAIGLSRRQQRQQGVSALAAVTGYKSKKMVHGTGNEGCSANDAGWYFLGWLSLPRE